MTITIVSNFCQWSPKERKGRHAAGVTVRAPHPTPAHLQPLRRLRLHRLHHRQRHNVLHKGQAGAGDGQPGAGGEHEAAVGRLPAVAAAACTWHGCEHVASGQQAWLQQMAAGPSGAAAGCTTAKRRMQGTPQKVASARRCSPSETTHPCRQTACLPRTPGHRAGEPHSPAPTPA